MHTPLPLFLLTIWLPVIGTSSARAEPPKPTASSRIAIERGLGFLQKDAVKWRKEHECSTCHHGTMTVWALTEAKSRGFDIAPEVLADNAKWTKDRLLARIDLPRDKRPGWSMVNTPALFLSTMALALPKQETVTADELKHIAGHLLRHQEADGSWAWSSAPAQNRPPPVFESDEVATLLAYAALGPLVPADAAKKSDVRDARTKAAAWLAKSKPNDTTQAAALRLFVHALARKPDQSLKTDIESFLARQNKDGGWGQVKDAPSDAYATGQALYVLALAGQKPDTEPVKRGVAFLVATQKDDGSWPMTPRCHPGAKPAKNTAPITYFGSAWATLGLLRSIEK